MVVKSTTICCANKQQSCCYDHRVVAHIRTLPLSLSHQTAGCLRRRNQCLLDSFDWGPPLPSDSRVMIGPANTDEQRHVGKRVYIKAAAI